MQTSDEFKVPNSGELWQSTLGWQPTPPQQAQFEAFYEAVRAGNQRLNLTRIIAPQDFWEKHLWDSLAGIAPLAFQTQEPTARRVIDIGTGAGFPGVPVAIACPQYQVTLLDSTGKKVNFLNEALARLPLPNARAIAARAEALADQSAHQEVYDVALLRAVGPPADCATYALPLLKPNGVAVLYRGHWSPTDAEMLVGALKGVGAVLSVEGFTTPLTQSVRHCIYIGKTGA